MLSYAFRALSEEKYQDIAAEEFEYAADLLAAILAKGISSQIKRGLGRDYIVHSESLSLPRGKIDIAASIKEHGIISHKLVCAYDSYEENTYLNQILKSTIFYLMKSEEVKVERKKILKKLMLHFAGVDLVALKHVHWKAIRYSKNNETYKMLISICYLAAEGFVLSDEKGNMKMSKYIDDRKMCYLYEKFLLAYYKKHYPEFNPRSSWIEWDEGNGFLELLPVMKSDITLEYRGKVTIIDAKFYSKMFQYNPIYHSKTLRSENLYQIFTYVKNRDINNDGSVSGVLLYAKTEDEENLDKTYILNKSQISVKSLDLNQDFGTIRSSLNTIAENMVIQNTMK